MEGIEVTFFTNWVAVALNAGCLVFLLYFWQAARRKARRNERGNEASYAVTFGVLFTFIGVTYSLFYFDSSSQDAILTSIPIFLDGMKTAFVTSVMGMIDSLLIKHIYRGVDTEEQKQEQEFLSCVQALPAIQETETAGNALVEKLVTEVGALDIPSIKTSLDTLIYTISKSSNTELAKAVHSLTEVMRAVPQKIDEQTRGFGRLQDDLRTSNDKMQDSILNLTGQIRTGNSDMQNILAGMAKDMEAVKTSMQASAEDSSAMLAATQDFHARQNAFSEQQIGKMQENTAQMARLSDSFDHFLEDMSNKFSDNFIHSLRGLIENLNKNLTEQFGENFKRLDDAVSKLNDWQQENKEQLAQLAEEYSYCYTSFKEFTEKLSTLGDGMEKCEQATNSFAHAAEAAVAQNGKLTESLAASKSTEEAMYEALEKVEDAQSALLEGQKANLQETQKLYASLVQTAANTTEKISDEQKKAQGIFTDGVRAQLAAVQKSFDETSAAFEEMGQEALKQIEAMEKERENRIIALEASAHEFSSTMEEATKQIGGVVEGFGVDWEGHMEEAIESVEESYKNIATQTQKAQEEAINQLAVALSGIAQKMTEDYGAVAEKIRELNLALKGA